MEELRAGHHALFFAYAVEEIFINLSEADSEGLIKDIMILYGNQRGRRMAKRAVRDKKPLDMSTYLDYTEWSLEPGEAQWIVEVKNGNTLTKVEKCPWYSSWKNNDIIKYGKYYCKYIDVAVLEGFNPELKLDVFKTLPESGECCSFIFYEGEKGNTVAGRTKPWKYHIANLINSFKINLNNSLSQETANKILVKSVRRFRDSIGDEFFSEIFKYEKNDFEVV